MLRVIPVFLMLSLLPLQNCLAADLHVSVKKGQLKEVYELLNQGVDANLPGKDQVTSLHIAADAGDLEMIALLLKHGAKVDVKAKHEATPLHWAVFKGHKEAANLLIKKAPI